MKTWLLFILCAMACLPCFAQTAMLESQKAAIAMFPDLAVKDSKFNKRFLEMVTAQRASDASFLQRDDWPLLLAKRTAEDLGVPIPNDVAGAPHVTTLDQPVGRITLHGKVMQRMEDGLLIGLNNGHGMALLRGFDAKEGQTITVPTMKMGPYDYTDLDGAKRRVDSYQALKAPQ